MTALPKDRQLEILLIEDNDGDMLLTQEALQEVSFQHRLHRVKNGEEALDFLHKRGDFVQAPTPHLILLDLNLPKMDGRQLLAKIKHNEETKKIPVIVLTTSKDEKDIATVYAQHGNAYLIKPIDFGEFTEVMRSLKDFWFDRLVFPKNPRP